MAWDTSSWLHLARTTQLVAITVATVAQAAVLQSHGGGGYLPRPPVEMIILELLFAVLLTYSLFTIAFLYFKVFKRRIEKKSWLTSFAVFDVIACFLTLVIITILANNGSPTSCNAYGCIAGILSYCMAMGLVLSYNITLALTILLIHVKLGSKKGTKIDELHDSLERVEDGRYKLFDVPSPCPSTPSLALPARLPPSEGVLTRRTSLHTITSAPTSTCPTCSLSQPPLSRIPRRPTAGQTPTATNSAAGQNATFIQTDADSESDPAAAALVADGMRHHQSSCYHHHPCCQHPEELPLQSTLIPSHCQHQSQQHHHQQREHLHLQHHHQQHEHLHLQHQYQQHLHLQHQYLPHQYMHHPNQLHPTFLRAMPLAGQSLPVLREGLEQKSLLTDGMMMTMRSPTQLRQSEVEGGGGGDNGNGNGNGDSNHNSNGNGNRNDDSNNNSNGNGNRNDDSNNNSNGTGMLPQYMSVPLSGPGMAGHGGEESNEMRLSGYVKGETRAQDMKDSGQY
ncbi:hypothetical protein N656DRAFT_800709 [Canariomyces notabilis]|uniref:Uncharacterized protein n=1 Tax=Canariomyces notabilis TaxID=2074819 RepID=A0AAN6TA98_9PEZI|nr:hypothetical protein N656DRAFT_800709 [Canariomyces arenarius]